MSRVRVRAKGAPAGKILAESEGKERIHE